MIDILCRARACLVVAVTALLAACGGGGGTAGPARASLIPAAPAQGALLYTDATTLRPTVPGGTWTFHGTHAQPDAVTTAYDNVIAHATGSGSTVVESATNTFDSGMVDLLLSVQTAQVTSTAFDWTGAALPTLAVEIRSPVHVGDQYKIDEETIADSGFDIDSDGKNDTVDFATYRSVAGNEMLTLPNIGQVTALRIDQIYLARFVVSSTQAVSPTVQFIQSVWYAPGLGLVRQRLTLPTSTSDEVYDEVLTSFDGLTQGAGVNAAVKAVVPQDGSAFAGLGIPGVLDALRFGDHAVVRTGKPGEFWTGGGTNAWSGMYFAVLDSRGNVQALRDYGSLIYFGQYTMLPAGAGFAEVAPPDSSGNGSFFLFDDQGRLTSSTTAVTYSVVNPALVGNYVFESSFASDGAGFWIVFRRLYVNVGVGFVYQMVARHLDYNGQPMGSEVILADAIPDTGSLNPRIAVAGNQIVATWGSGTQATYAAWTEGQTSPIARVLNSSASTANLRPLALAGTGQFALTWTTLQGGTQAAWGGVRLDGGYAPILSAGSSGVDSEIVSSTWGSQPNPVDFHAGSAAGQMFAGGFVTDFLWPTDTASKQLRFVSEHDMGGSGAFAATAPRLWRVETDAAFVQHNSDPTSRVLVFDDRLLLLAGDMGHMTASVIWKP